VSALRVVAQRDQRKLTGKEICIVIWPVKVDDPILGRASVLEFTNRHRVELFIEQWMKGSNSILSLDSLCNGSKVTSSNGDLVLTVKKCGKEYGKVWARNNHPNLKLRRSR
jgi:type IV pilus biogenesis protein CpaD/CtpE